MICIIIAILTMVGFLIYFHREYRIDLEGFFFSIMMGFIGLLVGFLVVIAGSAIWSACAEPSDWTVVDHEKTELVALKDGFHIEGTAFLFSSVANENLEYTYIYEEPGMGLTTGTVKAKSAYIKYIDANETPYIQEWEARPKSDLINWLFCPGEYKYTIYLPQGSVIENVYEVNLE